MIRVGGRWVSGGARWFWGARWMGGGTPAPVKGGVSRLKVQYITQGGLRPPLFVLFTSGGSKAGLHFSYLRYIENRLRDEFEFFATPIRLKERHKEKKKSQSAR